MIVQMHFDATKEEVKRVSNFFTEKGLRIKDISGEDVVIFGVIGDTRKLNPSDVEGFEGVFKVIRIQKPYKLGSRMFKKEDSVIHIKDDIYIGGNNFQVMAGSCSVETYEITEEIAKNLQENGVKIIRGGAFKPRTSPYSFQGLGEKGLQILKDIATKYNFAVVSEIVSENDVEFFDKYVDIYQVGARNMYNYSLLKALGKRTRKPVLLKRGLSATIEEWLMSAEYILAEGNPNVILCERGIRTFERYTRNTLDISAVLAVKELSHLPVIVDPSHGSGKHEMIEKLSLASMTVGADGLMVEIHPNPEKAYSDGAQSLKLENFTKLITKLNILKETIV